MPSILPSAQGKRITEPNTVHHLISRIAHRVFFLQEDERNDFVEMMRRVAGFTGIRLVGWCIMTNHFHILAILPEPEDLSELEIIRRYSLIHSKEDTATLVSELARFRASGPEGEQNVAWRLREIRKMMFSISWFMKILKEWFSKDYNGRTSHKGTLWEATYTDRPVRYNIDDMSFRLSYIHLNPYRAGLVTDFDSYCWSSLNAAVRGDVLALEGLHLVYGEECGAEEMLAEHHLRMAAALELGKRKRARDVAKLRRAGYMPKADALTDEAYVAQAMAHLDELQKSGAEIAYENRKVLKKCQERNEIDELRILRALQDCPRDGAQEIIRRLGITKSRAYKLMSELKDCCILP